MMLCYLHVTLSHTVCTLFILSLATLHALDTRRPKSLGSSGPSVAAQTATSNILKSIEGRVAWANPRCFVSLLSSHFPHPARSVRSLAHHARSLAHHDRHARYIAHARPSAQAVDGCCFVRWLASFGRSCSTSAYETHINSSYFSSLPFPSAI